MLFFLHSSFDLRLNHVAVFINEYFIVILEQCPSLGFLHTFYICSSVCVCVCVCVCIVENCWLKLASFEHCCDRNVFALVVMRTILWCFIQTQDKTTARDTCPTTCSLMHKNREIRACGALCRLDCGLTAIKYLKGPDERGTSVLRLVRPAGVCRGLLWSDVLSK